MRSPESVEHCLAETLARAWRDVSFKERLVADPVSVLAEAGVALAGGLTIRVLENTADRVHLVLPPQPVGSSLYRVPGRSALWSRIVARAWVDDAFKRRLLNAPAETLRAEGMRVPASVDLRVCENSDELFHLVLPAAPTEEVSDEGLEKVTAGAPEALFGPEPAWL